MKSKLELLGLQLSKEEKRFQEYIKLMEKIIKKRYPNGLDFDECPHIERVLYHRDIELSYYTNIDKELIKAIQRTKSFRKIANQLIDNGYEYELKSYVTYSWSRAEWEINLLIK